MSQVITNVGLDVHKKSIAVAMLFGDGRKPLEWKQPADAKSVKRLVRKLKKEAGGPVQCCYEAGPCGYALQRDLRSAGITCLVVAPSLIPVKPGERIKTDRRDAMKLAGLLRAELLTEVHPPTPDEEAGRDLCRCRAQILKDLGRSRHRLLKYLLRRGIVYRAGRNWTQRHRTWLRSVELSDVEHLTFDDYMLAVEQLEARLENIDKRLDALAQTEQFAKAVAWLRCFRGIDTVTAMSIAAEIHNIGRFPSAPELMAYLGLVPSEHTTGDSQRRGGITKAGNKYARRMLVEAAWHYRHRPGIGVALRKRREGQPDWVVAHADKAQLRLSRRYHHLVLHRGKKPQEAVVAVARELVGFKWGVLHPGLARAAQHT